MTLTGGCQCGAVRYEVSAEPLEVYVCHCRECRRQSASAFGISVIVPAEAFMLTQGNLRSWSRPTDSGRVLECMFCADCGTRIRHASARRGDDQHQGRLPGQPPGPFDGLPHLDVAQAAGRGDTGWGQML